ncbi:hypothetical protein TNCT_217631 [Trichonephila clavata]|uniref:Uncharacterized protein n=1 Tax=Trichonephila clavata TaxID=2740835 RepID=A0A8X6HXZ9_TRICU|nr:hypothetical protein TNCT_217631 [Trichonephila clavata]
MTRLVQRFRDRGLVTDRKRSGRASLVKTKVADVETALQRSLLKSSRKLILQLGMSLSSAWRTARELNFRPFKMHATHGMKPPEFEKRLHFYRWFRSF